MSHQRLFRLQTPLRWFLLLISLCLGHMLHAGVMARVDTSYAAQDRLPVIDIREHGYRPVAVSELVPADRQQAAHLESPNPPLVKEGPDYAAPGSVVEYALTVANYESVTRTITLTDTLPTGLAFVEAEPPLTYQADTNTISWQGEVVPGNLDYLITDAGTPLPYIDLADFGAVNLCDSFVTAGKKCADVTVTFNLGANGYQATLFGQPQSRLALSTDGLLLGDSMGLVGVPTGNQLLPDPQTPNLLLAGLWRDVDMTTAGRWHAAILRGLVTDHNVFYVQWHDASHALHPDQTSRHAIALVLDDAGEAATPLSGHAFYIYDNVADPAGTIAAGYTIGIEDRLGLRGATYAFSSPDQPPVGTPPEAGTTLHLQPVLFGDENAFRRTFRYTARVTAFVPETITNTAYAVTDSPDPTLQELWSTHYLLVRRLSFLPLLQTEGQP